MEIAERLGVQRATAHKWLQRAILPDPDWPSVSGNKAWDWSNVLRWAGETGHVRSAEAAVEYEKLTGQRPIEPRVGGVLARS